MGTQWYSVRSVFRHPGSKDKKTDIYEERITLWLASSFEEAVVLAETEALNYASEINCDYSGFSQVYQILQNEIKSGAEIFSLMRESEKGINQYIKDYFDTGREKLRKSNTN